MDSSELSLADAPASALLWEDTGAVCKTVYDGRVELAQHDSQGFLELIVDHHVLVDAEETMRQLVKGLDGKVDCIFPVVSVQVEFAAR